MPRKRLRFEFDLHLDVKARSLEKQIGWVDDMAKMMQKAFDPANLTKKAAAKIGIGSKKSTAVAPDTPDTPQAVVMGEEEARRRSRTRAMTSQGTILGEADRLG